MQILYDILYMFGFQHHSYRTYQGITCLMQLSTRSQDYIVDVLALRSEAHALNEVFTDPAIVKVSQTRAHFINDYLIVIQILWKFHFAQNQIQMT